MSTEKTETPTPIRFAQHFLPMIRDGRMTPTRRVIDPQPCEDAFEIGLYHPVRVDEDGEEYPGDEVFGVWGDDWDIPCPYGKPGDVLYVQEEWCAVGYKCAAIKARGDRIGVSDYERDKEWRPAETMPAWAARTLLRLTDVRAERLQTVSFADMIASGIEAGSLFHGEPQDHEERIVRQYRETWDALYPNHPEKQWAADPWVWALTFERKEET